VAIFGGLPKTSPRDAVTLDLDYSNPGDPLNPFANVGGATGLLGNTPAVLDGSTTPGGPFAHINQLRPGQVLTISQHAAASACVQHWRVFAQLGSHIGPNGRPSTRLELLLRGLTAHGSTWVDAVPAS
ncbi:MAG TPA: hypothetical protein VGI86_08600, partial [Acidimicrobiia bacterium]